MFMVFHHKGTKKNEERRRKAEEFILCSAVCGFG
jgi:hypothetical protein